MICLGRLWLDLCGAQQSRHRRSDTGNAPRTACTAWASQGSARGTAPVLPKQLRKLRKSKQKLKGGKCRCLHAWTWGHLIPDSCSQAPDCPSAQFQWKGQQNTCTTCLPHTYNISICILTCVLTYNVSICILTWILTYNLIIQWSYRLKCCVLSC